jgi:hypothetical protein
MPLFAMCAQHMYPAVNSNLEVADPADGKHTGADPAAFQRREFCFTLDNDIFVRYQSFKV